MEGVRKEVVTSGTDRAQARPYRKEEWHTRAMGRCKRGWRERLRARLVMQHAECQESDQEAGSTVASPYFRISH